MSPTNSAIVSKEALLEEGMSQLAEFGFHGTGIKQILDAVKVPKGSFYNYFDSKEAFVAEIICRYNQQSMELFDTLVSNVELSAIEKLQFLYRHMLEKYANAGYQHGCLIGSLAAEIGHRYSMCQIAMQSSVLNWQKRLATLITEAQQERSIREDISADSVAELLWTTWEGGLIKMQLDGNAESAERALDVLFKQLLVTQSGK